MKPISGFHIMTVGVLIQSLFIFLTIQCLKLFRATILFKTRNS